MINFIIMHNLVVHSTPIDLTYNYNDINYAHIVVVFHLCISFCFNCPFPVSNVIIQTNYQMTSFLEITIFKNLNCKSLLSWNLEIGKVVNYCTSISNILCTLIRSNVTRTQSSRY